MTSGAFNTLPLEIYGMTTNVTTPVLYAPGTVIDGVGAALKQAEALIALGFRRRRAAPMRALWPNPIAAC